MERATLEQRLERLERGVTRGLELLGSGRADEARELLAELAGAEEPGSGISDAELDRAFADAEPEVEHMRDADDVAHQAILQADRALEDEGELAPDAVGEHFATETMAGLLERQGDGGGAERIRAVLGTRRVEDGRPDGLRPNRGEVVATLELWLENLRGGARP